MDCTAGTHIFACAEAPTLWCAGLEGIVAKDARSLYEAGKRTGRWQKFKLNREEEFVIGGFVPGGNGGVETLVLGVPEGSSLRYVASLPLHVPLRASREVRTKLEPIRVALPVWRDTGAQARHLVAQQWHDS